MGRGGDRQGASPGFLRCCPRRRWGMSTSGNLIAVLCSRFAAEHSKREQGEQAHSSSRQPQPPGPGGRPTGFCDPAGWKGGREPRIHNVKNGVWPPCFPAVFCQKPWTPGRTCGSSGNSWRQREIAGGLYGRDPQPLRSKDPE